jgi:alcohol dehydrogenase
MAERAGQAAVFLGPGRPLEFHACEVPEPAGAEVLVRVAACTICASDRHSYLGRRATPLPSILGHEILGEVVEFGAEAARHDAHGVELKPGDRVTWGLVACCRGCFYCARNLPQKCVRLRKYGHEAWNAPRDFNGGLADYCVIYPGTALFHVPDSLEDAVACPANCTTATVAAAIEAAGDVAARRALVVGAGMLGVTATAWLRELGAEEVIVCDRLAERLELAESFGSTRRATPDDLSSVVAETSGGFGVDLVLEMSGAPEGVAAGLASLCVGGTLVLVGSTFPAGSVALDSESVVRRWLRIHGVHNYAPRHLAAALEFLSGQPVDRFAALVSDWLPLARAEEALAQAPAFPALRTGVRPGLV